MKCSKLNPIERARPLLGTYVRIAATHASPEGARGAVEDAFAAIAEVQRLMSFHDPESDLSRLNRLAHREKVAVSPWTYEVIRQAHELWVSSDGLFDVAVGQRLVELGFLPEFPEHASEGTTGDIELFEGNCIRFRQPLCLDLGGIAKGFAVDRAMDALRDAGADSGRVDAGGDLKLWGQEFQPIYVRKPARPDTLACLGQLAEGAVATSSGYFAREQVGADLAALVDPRTGSALPLWESVSVVASDCMVADALTKIVALDRAAAVPVLEAYAAQAFVLEDAV